jgi:hypothetical protein
MAKKLLSSAKVVDGVLILSLPNAVTPALWQMELGQSKSSALEVREQTDGTFMLVLKTPRQDVQDIAPFAAREDAVEALLAVAAAMEKAHGQLRQPQIVQAGPDSAGTHHTYLPAIVPHPLHTHPHRHRWIKIALGVLIVLGLIFFVTRPSPRAPIEDAGGNIGADGAPQTGEPVSADDFFKNQ